MKSVKSVTRSAMSQCIAWAITDFIDTSDEFIKIWGTLAPAAFDLFC